MHYVRHFPCSILSTSLGIVFYLSGYFLRKKQYNTAIIVLSSLTYTLAMVFCPSNVDFRSDKTSRGIWMVYVISSIAGIVLFNNLFKLKILQIPYLSSIGRHSLDYYCSHWILFGIISLAFGFYEFTQPNYWQLYSYILGSIIILPTFVYWKQLTRKRSPLEMK